MIDKRNFKSTPIKMLKDLVIEEVSLVDRPANPFAEVLVFKKDDYAVNKFDDLSVEKITAAKRDAALIGRLKKMGDDLEAMKAMAQNTIGIYDKLKIGRMKMGTVVEKILSKAFGSQVEAMDKLKLDLVKLAKADDSRSPERRLDDFLVSRPDVETAIRELPTAPDAEVMEKRDFGPTYSKISKMVDELVSKGTVSSRARGFVQVMDTNPELLISYYKEQQG